MYARVVTASCYNCCAHPFRVRSTFILVLAIHLYALQLFLWMFIRPLLNLCIHVGVVSSRLRVAMSEYIYRLFLAGLGLDGDDVEIVS